MHPMYPEEDEDLTPVAVPYTQLSAEALQGVIESFVLREGTEYGERDFTLAEKRLHVMHQLERGEAQITVQRVVVFRRQREPFRQAAKCGFFRHLVPVGDPRARPARAAERSSR